MNRKMRKHGPQTQKYPIHTKKRIEHLKDTLENIQAEPNADRKRVKNVNRLLMVWQNSRNLSNYNSKPSIQLKEAIERIKEDDERKKEREQALNRINALHDRLNRVQDEELREAGKRLVYRD